MSLRPLTDEELGDRLAPAIITGAKETGADSGDIVKAMELVAGVLATLEGVGVVLAADESAD